VFPLWTIPVLVRDFQFAEQRVHLPVMLSKIAIAGED